MKPAEKWLEEVPRTDAEAHEALDRDDELTAGNLRGIYQCRRERGFTALESFEAALLAHVGK